MNEIEKMQKNIKETKNLIALLPDCKQKEQRISHLKRLYRKMRILKKMAS